MNPLLSFRSDYLLACQTLSFPSNSTFLQQIDAEQSFSLTELVYCGSSGPLSKTGSICLSLALQKNTSVRSLELASNKMEDDGASAIVTSLSLRYQSFSVYITRLDLSGNSLTLRSCGSISDYLLSSSGSHLSTLILRNNKLESQGAQRIFKAVCASRTLESLDVSSCGIGAEIAESFGELLSLNSSIANLSVSHNRFGDRVLEHAKDALAVNPTLVSLNLESCQLGFQAAKAILAALSINNTLLTLDLKFNNISPAIASGISKSLERNSRRVSLHAQSSKSQIFLLQHSVGSPQTNAHVASGSVSSRSPSPSPSSSSRSAVSMASMPDASSSSSAYVGIGMGLHHPSPFSPLPPPPKPGSVEPVVQNHHRLNIGVSQPPVSSASSSSVAPSPAQIPPPLASSSSSSPYSTSVSPGNGPPLGNSPESYAHSPFVDRLTASPGIVFPHLMKRYAKVIDMAEALLPPSEKGLLRDFFRYACTNLERLEEQQSHHSADVQDVMHRLQAQIANLTVELVDREETILQLDAQCSQLQSVVEDFTKRDSEMKLESEKLRQQLAQERRMRLELLDQLLDRPETSLEEHQKSDNIPSLSFDNADLLRSENSFLIQALLQAQKKSQFSPHRSPLTQPSQHPLISPTDLPFHRSTSSKNSKEGGAI
eukprot:ANDGO_00982.mRNA.1 hypothetical protein CAOG_05004